MLKTRKSYHAQMLIAALLTIGVAPDTITQAQGLAAGTYRCSSYNVSGGSGSCRTMPQLVLKPDGTYQHSSTHGRWDIQGGKLVLSASKLWGPGTILGKDTVRFEYDFRDLHHTVTWICAECGQTDSTAPVPR